VRAITIDFNYDMDINGFFGTDSQPTPARTALEFVGNAFQPFQDKLSPIVPGGMNSWSAFFPHPNEGFQACACNISIPEDTVVIYVGARDLPGTEIANAGPGVWGVDNPETATPQFVAAVGNRGQGSVLDDYAPWGGVLAFDTTLPGGNARTWHFDVHALPAVPAYDFASVAMHEIAHIFGFGISAPFLRQTDDHEFHGPLASELYGGSISLAEDNAHWSSNVFSPPFNDDRSAALGPSLAAGERILPSPLDYAALADVGWQVPAALFELTGDADGDDDVDGADILLWQRNMGVIGGQADVNNDHFVDSYDGWLIAQNLGASAPAPQSAGAAPEPNTAQLIVAVWLAQSGLLCWRQSWRLAVAK